VQTRLILAGIGFRWRLLGSRDGAHAALSLDRNLDRLSARRIVEVSTSEEWANGGSVIFHSECQVAHVMGCIKALIEGAAAMECKDEPFRRYVDEYTKVCAGMVWAHPGTRNWYKNSCGVVVNTWPWR
jgi:hypothetical protein